MKRVLLTAIACLTVASPVMADSWTCTTLYNTTNCQEDWWSSFPKQLNSLGARIEQDRLKKENEELRRKLEYKPVEIFLDRESSCGIAGPQYYPCDGENSGLVGQP